MKSYRDIGTSVLIALVERSFWANLLLAYRSPDKFDGQWIQVDGEAQKELDD